MLNDEEYNKLRNDISRAKISQADYIRKLIMNKKIREKPDDRFYNVMMQLTAIGNNLNQIAHKANYLNEEAFMEEKYILEFDRYERGITLNALNHLRNKLLEDGIDTDTVDDLILKILDTPSKKRGFTLSNLKGINTR